MPKKYLITSVLTTIIIYILYYFIINMLMKLASVPDTYAYYTNFITYSIFPCLLSCLFYKIYEYTIVISDSLICKSLLKILTLIVILLILLIIQNSFFDFEKYSIFYYVFCAFSFFSPGILFTYLMHNYEKIRSKF